MQVLQVSQRQSKPAVVPRLTFDLLVVNATDLIGPQRASLLRHIHWLGTYATQNAAGGGIWLLLMTHDVRQETAVSVMLTTALSRCSWCRGVRAVEEGTAEETAQAAIDLHRLHFPDIADTLRPARILVLGSKEERRFSASAWQARERR